MPPCPACHNLARLKNPAGSKYKMFVCYPCGFTCLVRNLKWEYKRRIYAQKNNNLPLSVR